MRTGRLTNRNRAQSQEFTTKDVQSLSGSGAQSILRISLAIFVATVKPNAALSDGATKASLVRRAAAMFEAGPVSASMPT